MKKWKLSRYTIVFPNDAGEMIFHNSFMGAVAVVPARKFDDIRKFLKEEIPEDHLKNDALMELCEEGFFCPSDVDEQNYVTEVLEKESESEGFHLILLPHENCNFRCDYCYERHERGKMESDVIDGLKAFVERKAATWPSLKVSWFGGEPLLAKDIINELSRSFIRSCSANSVPYSGDITTNGYLLSPDVVDSLLESRVTAYQITLDGPESTHDTTRKLAGGGKTYKTILNNLIEMQKRNADFQVTIRVNFNHNSLVVMERFFEEIADGFHEDRRFKLYFRPISKWGGPNDDHIDVYEPQEGAEIAMELTDKFASYGYIADFMEVCLESHGSVCYAAKESSIVVGSDGTVYKCTTDFEDPQNHVGKLTKEGQLTVDQSLWDHWVKNDDKDMSSCAACPLMPACQGKQCPRNAIQSKKPQCPYTVNEYARMVSLIAAISRNRRFA